MTSTSSCLFLVHILRKYILQFSATLTYLLDQKIPEGYHYQLKLILSCPPHEDVPPPCLDNLYGDNGSRGQGHIVNTIYYTSSRTESMGKAVLHSQWREEGFTS